MSDTPDLAGNVARRLPPFPDWKDHALFVDFDGTLVPIVERPQDVRLSDSTRQLLLRVIRASDGAVAVLSGRALESLAGHLQGLPLALSGSHGLERLLPDGRSVMAEDGAPAEALERAFAGLKPFARSEGLLLEHKPGAVALHYRNRPDRAEICQAAVARVAEAQELRVLHGNMVSEAALAGVDKGHALRGFLAEAPFANRIPIMVGDDTTDEDGFRAAQELGGFGVRIGQAGTVARFQVPRMEDALSWLSASLEAEPERR
jgi:trehalose 6-phosphate phosphatase